MKFSKQDRKEYATWLADQITEESKKIESIFTNYNIYNLTKDLVNINKTIN